MKRGSMRPKGKGKRPTGPARRPKAGSWKVQEIPRDYPVAQQVYDRLKRRIDLGVTYGVAARVEDRLHRILLVRQHPGTGWSDDWMTPGGGVEPGETPEAAVVREIMEEAGVRVTGLFLWRIYRNSYFSPNPRDPPVRFDIYQYLADWSSGRPSPRVPQEISEARWFSRLPKRMAFRADWLFF